MIAMPRNGDGLLCCSNRHVCGGLFLDRFSILVGVELLWGGISRLTDPLLEEISSEGVVGLDDPYSNSASTGNSVFNPDSLVRFVHNGESNGLKRGIRIGPDGIPNPLSRLEGWCIDRQLRSVQHSEVGGGRSAVCISPCLTGSKAEEERQ